MNRPSLQGSVFWMAPEVVQQKTHTGAADIWSVGCLVVEMLTGEHPWAQLTQMQAIFKVFRRVFFSHVAHPHIDRPVCEACDSVGYFGGSGRFFDQDVRD